MRVLILCDSAAKASQLDHAVSTVEGIECQALVCRNGSTALPLFLLKQLARLVLAGPRCLWNAVRLALRGRMHLRCRSFSEEAVLQWVRDQKFDIGLHAMGIIYRRPMIDAFRLGILNPHIGLLPEFRGRSVMEWSLVEGAATGITAFFIDEGIDTGSPIVLRREVELTGFGNLAAAKRHLFAKDGEMFAAALQQLLSADDRPQMQSPEQGRRYYPISSLLEQVAEAALAARAAIVTH